MKQPSDKQQEQVAIICLTCQEKLEYFSGVEHIPEFLYCPKCNDKAYDFDGKVLFLLV